MNGLTLRVSSEKKSKPIKKEIDREDIVSILLPKYADHIKSFDKIISATFIEDQIQAFREVFSSILIKESNDEYVLIIIDIFIHLVLSIKPKSHLSPPLLRLLSNLPPVYDELVEKCVNSHLVMRMTKETLSVDEIEEYAGALQLCLANKKTLRFSLGSCHTHVLDFLTKSISQAHSLFKTESGAMKKLSIISIIHSCIQAGIKCIEEDKLSGNDDLSRLVVEVLSDSELPIDTRSTAAILAAHLSSDSSQQQILNRLNDCGNHLGVLCFCSGLLNVLTPHQLRQTITVNSEPEPVLNFIFNTIITIEEANASECGIVLVATRCILLLSKSLCNMPPDIIKDILSPLLDYIWCHIDHFMDSVRHLALTALSNLQSIANVHQELDIFNRIAEDVARMGMEKRSKFAAISVLLSHTPVSTILSENPGLVPAILSLALGTPSSSYAVDTLESLMQQDWKEGAQEEMWFERWVQPLLCHQLSASLERLITTAFKLQPSILQKILLLGVGESKILRMEVFLTCIKVGRKLNLIGGDDSNGHWKGFLELKILEKCVYSNIQEVRLACFGLLVESSKPTEAFTSVELDLIQIFLKYNISDQDPAFRQRTLALTKKLLVRLRDGEAGLKRRLRRDTDSETIKKALDHYVHTADQLRNLCLDSLFPGASPGRRSFAIALLALFHQHGFKLSLSDRTVQVLFGCLLDSYEENKTIAKQLLSLLPPDKLKFQDKDHIEKYITSTLQLCSSIRPPESMSAAYFMGLLASYSLVVSDSTLEQGSRYYCLSRALESLSSELSVAKESLLEAACSGPLYGHLFLIRHLLNDFCLKEVSKSERWQNLVERTIEVAFECKAVVADVVYNSSPEGHLPMDFTYQKLRKESDRQVTSQMVLLCSWRTIKEVSLLLGELVEGTANGYDFGVLSENQIVSIGEHLSGLLAETKHRGAFEQAYLAFSKLALTLWRCSNKKLNMLPKKWLDETLQCISSNESLSATRRSAGIPFIVQALICTELESGSSKSLHSAMKSLLHMANNSLSEGRVHALNILRALYRGSSLGEAVGPYVAQGIATALNGFNSNTWAERNSSTLLMSALMSRVFGVPRAKSEYPTWRNKMTGRLFFQRYPTLYMELLSHLEASSTKEMYPALYPVLLLLARLYPSSLEGTDSNLQLMKYLPYVVHCSESSILKTRYLAATAVSSLIPSFLYVDYINQFIASLNEVKKENCRHGLLLMILEILRRINDLEDIQQEKLKDYISSWINTLLKLLLSPSISFVSRETCVQVLLYLFLNLFEEICLDNIKAVEEGVKDILSKTMSEDSCGYGCQVFYSHTTVLLFLINIKNKDTCNIIRNIISFLQNSLYEVSTITLQFLNYLLSGKQEQFVSNLNKTLKFNLFDDFVKNDICNKIKNSNELKMILLNSIFDESLHPEDMARVLSCLKYMQGGVESLKHPVEVIDNICRKSPRTISCQALDCLTVIQNNIVLTDGDLETVCDLVEEYSNEEVEDDCREAVANLLATNYYYLLQKARDVHKITLWTCTIRLMLDEEATIRDKICMCLVGDVVPLKGVECFIERFCNDAELQSAVVGLLYLAVGSHSSSALPVDSDECLFEKGEANSFYEELTVNRIACRQLEKMAKENPLFRLLFDDAHSEWLTRRTNINASSIKDFIDAYRSSIISCQHLTDLLPYRLSENQYVLQNYKLENLVKVNCLL